MVKVTMAVLWDIMRYLQSMKIAIFAYCIVTVVMPDNINIIYTSLKSKISWLQFCQDNKDLSSFV